MQKFSPTTLEIGGNPKETEQNGSLLIVTCLQALPEITL